MYYKRCLVLLASFASCAGLATTGFAGEPPTWMRPDQANVSERQQDGNTQCLYLIKLLAGSSQFRVRAQAAISLGLMEKSAAARDALTAALQDEHPAVRAAAATSLGRLGDAKHVSELRKLGGDPEEPVRHAASTSIGRIESAIELARTAREAGATTAALTATTSTNKM